MQKLIFNISHKIPNNRGSALVIAVVLALLMAIAGIGFLLVTTLSANNDTDAYNRERGLYAAESGAMMATKYLMSRVPGSWPASGTVFLRKQINDVYVKVTINKNGNLAEVRSEAFTSGTTQNATTFLKRVIIKVQHDGL